MGTTRRKDPAAEAFPEISLALACHAPERKLTASLARTTSPEKELNALGNPDPVVFHVATRTTPRLGLVAKCFAAYDADPPHASAPSPRCTGQKTPTNCERKPDRALLNPYAASMIPVG